MEKEMIKDWKISDYLDKSTLKDIRVLKPWFKIDGVLYHNDMEWKNQYDDDNRGSLISERWNDDGKVDHLQSMDFLAIYSNSGSRDWRHYEDEYPITSTNGIFVSKIETPDMNYCVLGFDEVAIEIATILSKVLSYDEMVTLTQKGNKLPKLWDNLYTALIKYDPKKLANLTGLSIEIFKPLIDKANESIQENSNKRKTSKPIKKLYLKLF